MDGPKREMPTCKYCGEPHWYVTPCEPMEKALRKPANPPRFHPPNEEREWRDRLSTVQRLGENTFVQVRRKARPTGLVTPDPRWATDE